MIKDDGLSNRLNARKKGIPVEDNKTEFIKQTDEQLELMDKSGITEEPYPYTKTFWNSMFTLLTYGLIYIVIPLILGLALNTLLNKHWKFIPIYCVGYLTYYILDEFKLIFKK
jgi:ABC-type sugar transport system permease subunit